MVHNDIVSKLRSEACGRDACTSPECAIMRDAADEIDHLCERLIESRRLNEALNSELEIERAIADFLASALKIIATGGASLHDWFSYGDIAVVNTALKVYRDARHHD